MTLVLVTRFREHFEPLRIRLVAQIVQPIDFIGAGGVTNSATLGPFSYSWFPCVIYNDLVTAHLQTIMFPNVWESPFLWFEHMSSKILEEIWAY